MNAHSFFSLLQNCFLPRNQVNPSLQILSCATWEEENTYNAKHVGEHSRSSSGPKPPAAQHPQKPRLLGTVPRASAVLFPLLPHLFLLLLLLPSIKPSIPSKEKQLPCCCCCSSSLFPCLLQPYTQREQASKQASNRRQTPPPHSSLLSNPHLLGFLPNSTQNSSNPTTNPAHSRKSFGFVHGLLQLTEDLNCKKNRDQKKLKGKQMGRGNLYLVQQQQYNKRSSRRRRRVWRDGGRV